MDYQNNKRCPSCHESWPSKIEIRRIVRTHSTLELDHAGDLQDGNQLSYVSDSSIVCECGYELINHGITLEIVKDMFRDRRTGEDLLYFVRKGVRLLASDSEVPEQLISFLPYRYGIRGKDKDFGDPCTVELSVVVNRWGTLYAETPLLDITSREYISIDDDDKFKADLLASATAVDEYKWSTVTRTRNNTTHQTKGEHNGTSNE